MATVYLRSTDGSDGDDGSTWALADATLAASLTAAGAGGRSYVSDNHAETQASAMTLTSAGTASSPTEVLGSDDAAEPPTALATTATVSTTGVNSIAFHGFCYAYGLTFQAGSTTSQANLDFRSSTPWGWTFDTCGLTLNNSSAASLVLWGNSAANGDDQSLTLLNSTLTFGAVGQSIALRGSRVRWRGGSVAGTAPTTLVTVTGGLGNAVDMVVHGVDLSLLGSGKNLVSVAGACPGLIEFVNCKLGSSVSPVTGTRPGPGGVNVRLVNCSAADTNYSYFFDTYEGQISDETVIVRTGGASDGTTAFSRKMVSSANTKFYLPLFDDRPLLVWNDTLGSVTVTVEVVTDNVTLTDAEAWIEVEYPDTSGFPLASFTSDRAANILATPANQTSSSVAWTTSYFTVSSANATAGATYTNNGNTYTVQETIAGGLTLRCDGTGAPQASGTLTKASGTGDATITFSAVTYLTTPIKQKLSVTITPAEVGWIQVRVMLAKASTTLFFCPKVDVT